MIDLEQALAPLVDAAPDAPGIEQLRSRVRQRRHRRVRGALGTAFAVALVSSAAVVASTRDTDRPPVIVASETTHRERVTLLDGVELEITTKAFELGAPRYHAAVGLDGLPDRSGRAIDVVRAVAPERAAGMAVYPTADGHEMLDAPDNLTVAYGQWLVLIASDNLTDADKTRIASLFRARETSSGLVVEPIDPMRLEPIAAPDVEFGDGTVGLLVAAYRDGCPDQSTRRVDTTTPDGLAVTIYAESGAWWCDPVNRVRIHVGDHALIDDAIQGLRVRRLGAPGGIPPGPLDARVQPALFLDGDQLIAWGGSSDADKPGRDGAILDVSSGEWATIPPAPIDDGSAAAVLTIKPSTLVVVGSGSHETAVFDLRDRRWRELDPAPLERSCCAINARWTPDGVLAWQWQPAPAAALLDLTDETWHSVPAPPLGERFGETAVYHDGKVVIWGGQRFNNTPEVDGAEFDTATRQWRLLANAPPIDEFPAFYSGFYRPSAVWTEQGEMLVWGWTHQSLGENTEGLAYNPPSDTWRRIAEAPIEPSESCNCAGGDRAVMGEDGRMLVWTGNLDRRGSFLLAYDPPTDTWATLAGPFPFAASIIATPSEVFVWGPQLRIPLP